MVLEEVYMTRSKNNSIVKPHRFPHSIRWRVILIPFLQLVNAVYRVAHKPYI